MQLIPSEYVLISSLTDAQRLKIDNTIETFTFNCEKFCNIPNSLPTRGFSTPYILASDVVKLT